MITILDYGVGNVHAFLTMFKRLNIPVQAASSLEELKDVSKLILPGVGAFDHAMNSFNNSGLRSGVEQLVLYQNIPILGVCVGMQMLGTKSDEGTLPGLNWIPGRIIAFSQNFTTKTLPSPHMGWNDVHFKDGSLLNYGQTKITPQFYFLHSYYFDAEEKCHVDATAEYGFRFDAALSKGNIYGVQFHPEKSHSWGTQLLKNFSEI